MGEKNTTNIDQYSNSLYGFGQEIDKPLQLSMHSDSDM